MTLGAVSAQEGSSADVLAVDSASSPVLGDGVTSTVYSTLKQLMQMV
ncbi:hypothetical protein [Methanobrevibacter smithii]|nr:hypothetical protein [Methanobrevibacter smithii]